jgi:hypothetical protein
MPNRSRTKYWIVLAAVAVATALSIHRVGRHHAVALRAQVFEQASACHRGSPGCPTGCTGHVQTCLDGVTKCSCDTDKSGTVFGTYCVESSAGVWGCAPVGCTADTTVIPGNATCDQAAACQCICNGSCNNQGQCGSGSVCSAGLCCAVCEGTPSGAQCTKP